MTFAFTAAGCDLLKSDQEKFDELTTKFRQASQEATTEKEIEKLGKDYKNAVPKTFKDQATGTVNTELFMFDTRKYKGIKLGGGSEKIANYPE